MLAENIPTSLSGSLTARMPLSTSRLGIVIPTANVALQNVSLVVAQSPTHHRFRFSPQPLVIFALEEQHAHQTVNKMSGQQSSADPLTLVESEHSKFSRGVLWASKAVTI